MKVIFVQDVRSRDKHREVKNVPSGYAQNYLIKGGLARETDKGNLNTLKRIETNEKAAYEAEEADVIKIKKQLESDNTVVQFKSKAGTDDRLFGSISGKKIVEGLEQQFDLEIDKRKLKLPEPVKALGYANVKVKLFKGVESTIRIHITEEQGST